MATVTAAAVPVAFARTASAVGSSPHLSPEDAAGGGSTPSTAAQRQQQPEQGSAVPQGDGSGGGEDSTAAEVGDGATTGMQLSQEQITAALFATDRLGSPRCPTLKEGAGASSLQSESVNGTDAGGESGAGEDQQEGSGGEEGPVLPVCISVHQIPPRQGTNDSADDAPPLLEEIGVEGANGAANVTAPTDDQNVVWAISLSLSVPIEAFSLRFALLEDTRLSAAGGAAGDAQSPSGSPHTGSHQFANADFSGGFSGATLAAALSTRTVTDDWDVDPPNGGQFVPKVELSTPYWKFDARSVQSETIPGAAGAEGSASSGQDDGMDNEMKGANTDAAEGSGTSATHGGSDGDADNAVTAEHKSSADEVVAVTATQLLEIHAHRVKPEGGKKLQAPGASPLLYFRLPAEHVTTLLEDGTRVVTHSLCVFDATFIDTLEAAASLEWSGGGSRCTLVPPLSAEPPQQPIPGPPAPPLAVDQDESTPDVVLELSFEGDGTAGIGAAGGGDGDGSGVLGGAAIGGDGAGAPLAQGMPPSEQVILAVNVVSANAPIMVLAFTLVDADNTSVPILSAGGGQAASLGYAVSVSRQFGLFQAVCLTGDLAPGLAGEDGSGGAPCEPLQPNQAGENALRLVALVLSPNPNTSLPLRLENAVGVSDSGSMLTVASSP